MEYCVRCNISSERVQLFDCIYYGKLDKICERCSIIENIDLIKKPDQTVLKKSERPLSVYERLKISLFGKDAEDKKERERIIREERLKELDKNPQLEFPVSEQLNLIDHFHWEIMKNRRRRGLSYRQLGEAISEPEALLEMLEKGKLPDNADLIIRKLEQFFRISLRKISESEAYLMNKNKVNKIKPVLLDEYGRELEYIPEPEAVFLNKNFNQEKTRETSLNEKEEGKKEFEKTYNKDPMFSLGRPWRRGSMVLKERKEENKFKNDEESFILRDNEDFDLKKVDISKVKVGDLKEFHRKKVLAIKEERLEEQRKIEERNRLIEARKEELRLIKEKQSREIDSFLGGSELLSRKKSFERF
ncbi:MAG: hypothetical protein QXW97_04095 [Candidatus Pacearchaeota archaeon]